MDTTPELTEASLMQYLCGERTWAELVGFTAEQAQVVAEHGVACMAAGKLPEAIVVFDGLLAFNPRDAFAHAVRGALYEQEGDDTSALAHYCAAVELEPEFLAPRLARAEALLRLGHRALARADLDAAAACAPVGPEAARLHALRARLTPSA
jgi:regulator of sirC expression with transglutaminase-like and TPR domain